MSAIDLTDELVSLYLTESGQMVQKFEKLIMASDRSGELSDPPELFRLLHTLKGTSAMMSYTPLVDTAHAFEDVLSVIKKRALPLSDKLLTTIVDAALAFAAYFRTQLAHIGEGAAPEADWPLLAEIKGLASLLGVSQGAPTVGGEKTPAGSIPAAGGAYSALIKLKSCPMPHIRASVIVRSVSALCAAVNTVPTDISHAGACADTIGREGFTVFFDPLPPHTAQEVCDALGAQPFVVSCQLQKTEPHIEDEGDAIQTVTVTQSVVNDLIGLMGEISTAEAAVETYLRESGRENGASQSLLSALRGAVAEAGVLAAQIGVHEVDIVFTRMQRAVREMAKELQKEVRVVTEGASVQVDKSVLDILSDSLIHMVRNAVDHGIETPAQRQALGKPPTGLISLRAEKKNNELTVTVADDGGGIRRQAVLESAQKRGKLTKPPERYTDREVGNLLLFGGVSTTPEVTQYSGRGVGLDTAVRRIRQVGGRISMESRENQGSTFTLHIPVTLLTIDGVLVTLMDGNELIVPANAIAHIAKTAASGEYVYHGQTYAPLLFPGQQAGIDEGEGYTLLFTPDFGPYCIRLRHVSMMAGYYIKELPSAVTELLGRDNIYAGCVLCPDTRLRCVLDAAKLIDVADMSQSS